MEHVSKRRVLPVLHVPAETIMLATMAERCFLWGVRAATVAMHRRGKYTSSTIEAVFSALSLPRNYLEDNWCYSGVEGSVLEC
jgi:hypothetical protein